MPLISFTYLLIMVNPLAYRIANRSRPNQPMEPEKHRLLERIDRDRELLITFLQ